MKDIKDFLKSPTKPVDNVISSEGKDSLLKEKNEDCMKETLEDSKSIGNMKDISDMKQGEESTKQVSKKENINEKIKTPKRKYKKHKNKTPDPVVSDISDLMSTSLSMISPDRGIITDIKKKLLAKLQKTPVTEQILPDSKDNEANGDYQNSTSNLVTSQSAKENKETGEREKFGYDSLLEAARNIPQKSPKRKLKKKSKLSLNSSDTNISKLDTSQSNLNSFFQKVTPNSKIEKTSSDVEETADQNLSSAESKEPDENVSNENCKINNENKPTTNKKDYKSQNKSNTFKGRNRNAKTEANTKKQNDIIKEAPNIDVSENTDDENFEVIGRIKAKELRGCNTSNKNKKKTSTEELTLPTDASIKPKQSINFENNEVNKLVNLKEKTDDDASSTVVDIDPEEARQDMKRKFANIFGNGKKITASKENLPKKESDLNTPKNLSNSNGNSSSKKRKSTSKRVSFSNKNEEISPPVVHKKNCSKMEANEKNYECKYRNNNDDDEKEATNIKLPKAESVKTSKEIKITPTQLQEKPDDVEDITPLNTPTDQTEQKINSSEKVINAFNFLMNSRNKSIGSNSPGKDVKMEVSPSTHEEKQKLSARKLKFESWANAKGGLKRKIEEEERDEIIKEKLEIRAKRLKKLLTKKDEEEPKSHNKSKDYSPNSTRNKRKRIRKLSSEEDSNNSDMVISEEVKESGKKSTKKIKTDYKMVSDEVEKSSEANRINLETTIEVFDNIEEEPVLKMTQKNIKGKNNTARQSGLLNFIEVKKKVEDEGEDELHVVTDEEDDKKELNNTIKIKMFSPLAMKRGSSKLALKKKLDQCNTSGKVKINSQTTRSKEVEDESKVLTLKKRIVKNSECSTLENTTHSVDEVSSTDDTLTEKVDKAKSKPEASVDFSNKKHKKLKKRRRKDKRKCVPKGMKLVPKIKIKLPTDDDEAYSIVSDGSTFEDIDVLEYKDDDSNSSNENNDNNFSIQEATFKENRNEKEIPKSQLTKIQKNLSIKMEEEIIDVTDKVNLRRSQRTGQKKVYEGMIKIDEITSSEEEKEKIMPKKNVKVAPVFVNAAPKPKLDPAVLEARKNFLYSGVPDSLKKLKEKQQMLEELEGQLFPSISHVLQKPEKIENGCFDYWNLPKISLDLKSFDNVNLPSYNSEQLSVLNKTDMYTHSKFYLQPPKKLRNFKHLLEEIKHIQPEYPVYKVFRQLRKKCGLKPHTEEMETIDKNKKLNKRNSRRKSKRGRKKKEDKDTSIELIEDSPVKPSYDPSDFSMWTDKYKPQRSDEIIGNQANVSDLKKWLESWLEFSENTTKAKRKGYTSSSSEFENTDVDTRYSFQSVENAVVLSGPHGSGKSSALYAVCQELGINVLELNASSKRTGKRLLQELQEATQSHQVRANEGAGLSSFLQSKKPKESGPTDKKGESNSSNKMCVLLVEDVDIVYEQDEGFLSALITLMNSSKRPIVVTTTDMSSPHLQRFISQYRVIQFSPLSSRLLATWLQITCLLEGVKVDRESIAETLEWNKGDVRRTLLQLQFWALSGGNIHKGESVKHLCNEIQEENSKIEKNGTCLENGVRSRCRKTERDSIEAILHEDISNDSFIESEVVKQDKVETHYDCLYSFQSINNSKIPYPLNLGKFWWNFSTLLMLEDISCSDCLGLDGDSLNFSNIESNAQNNENKSTKRESDLAELKELENISDLCDSLSLVDNFNNKFDRYNDTEPTPTRWKCALKDSLELSECMLSFDHSREFTEDWSHTVVVEHLNNFKHKKNGKIGTYLMAVPTTEQKRWRSKQHSCEDSFLDCLPLTAYTDRRSFSLDYFPVLRNIARSESSRCCTTNKRNNRFLNYLRTLGIHSNESVFKTACDMLT